MQINTSKLMLTSNARVHRKHADTRQTKGASRCAVPVSAGRARQRGRQAEDHNGWQISGAGRSAGPLGFKHKIMRKKHHMRRKRTKDTHMSVGTGTVAGGQGTVRTCAGRVILNNGEKGRQATCRVGGGGRRSATVLPSMDKKGRGSVARRLHKLQKRREIDNPL